MAICCKLEDMWFQLRRPAPILNTPEFRQLFGGASGVTIPVDSNGHPQHIESVALPGMAFAVLREMGDILEILWPEYGIEPLYIDRRFGALVHHKPTTRCAALPTASILLERMERRLGTPYVWGGNWAEGIPELLEYYPPRGRLDARTHQLWTMQGVDCSGLLFEASDGLTPRNTSALMEFGRKLSPEEPLEPLDLIVYPGHVLFVRDAKNIIESKSPMGVRLYPLMERLEELRRERRPFVIRRFAKKG